MSEGMTSGFGMWPISSVCRTIPVLELICGFSADSEFPVGSRVFQACPGLSGFFSEALVIWHQDLATLSAQLLATTTTLSTRQLPALGALSHNPHHSPTGRRRLGEASAVSDGEWRPESARPTDVSIVPGSRPVPSVLRTPSSNVGSWRF